MQDEFDKYLISKPTKSSDLSKTEPVVQPKTEPVTQTQSEPDEFDKYLITEKPQSAKSPEAVDNKYKLSFTPEEEKSKDYMSMFDKTPQQKTAEQTGTSIELVNEVEQAAANAVKIIPPEKKYRDYKNDKIYGGFKETFPELAPQIESIEQRAKSSNPNLQMDAAGDFEKLRQTLVNDPRYVDYEKTFKNDNVDDTIEAMLNDTKRLNSVIEKMQMSGGFTRENALKVFKEVIPGGISAGMEEYVKGYTELFKRINQSEVIGALSQKWDRIQKGEDIPLTENEKILTQVYFENVKLHQQFEDEVPEIYNIAKGAGYSLGFMGEFVGFGLGAKAVTGAAKTFLTAGRIGSQLKPLELATIKLIEVGIKTAEMPSVYRIAAEKVAGGESFGSALMNSYAETFPEILTEYMFIRSSDEAVKGLMNKFFKKAGLTFKTDQGALGAIRNTAEEYFEEKMADISHAPEDFKSFSAFWKNFISLKQNARTFGAVVLVSGGLTAPSVIGSSYEKVRSSVVINALKGRLPKEIVSDIDLIVKNKDISNEEAVNLIFNSIDSRLKEGIIPKAPNKVVVDALRYAKEMMKKGVSDTLDKGEKEEILPAPEVEPILEKAPAYTQNGIDIEPGTLTDIIDSAQTPEDLKNIGIVNDDQMKGRFDLATDKVNKLAEETKSWNGAIAEAGTDQKLLDKAEKTHLANVTEIEQTYKQSLQKLSTVNKPTEKKLAETKVEKPVTETVETKPVAESKPKNETVKSEQKTTTSKFKQITTALGITKPQEGIEKATRGKVGKAEVIMSEGKDENEVVIESIVVPEKIRGKKHGRDALAKITQKADDLGVTLRLRAHPQEGSKLTEQQLIDWYKKPGNDFEFEEGKIEGVRKPHTIITTKTGERIDVTEHIKKISKGAVNALKSVVVNDVSELADLMKGSKEENLFRNAKGAVEALYHPKTGTVYFVKTALKSKDDIVRLWAHEQGVHRGLRVLFPDEGVLRKVMVKVFNSVDWIYNSDGTISGVKSQGEGKKFPTTYINEFNKRFSEAKKSGNAEEINKAKAWLAEEYMAKIAEKIIKEEDLTPAEKSVWQKFVEWINDVLSKIHNADMKFTSEEIADMVNASVKSLYQETIKQETGGKENTEETGTGPKASGKTEGAERGQGERFYLRNDEKRRVEAGEGEKLSLEIPDRVFNKFKGITEEQKELANLFKKRMDKMKKKDPKEFWSVDMPNDVVIAKAAVNNKIVDAGGGMSIVKPDGDMVGLFKYDFSKSNVAEANIREQIKNGGIKLDNYDIYLTHIYARNGFRVVARAKFNNEMAPKDMPQELREKKPDVVAMIYDPNNELDIKEKTFGKDGYFEALKYRDSYLNAQNQILTSKYIRNDKESKGRIRDIYEGEAANWKSVTGKGETSPSGTRLVNDAEIEVGDVVFYNGDRHEVTKVKGNVISLDKAGKVDRTKILSQTERIKDERKFSLAENDPDKLNDELLNDAVFDRMRMNNIEPTDADVLGVSAFVKLNMNGKSVDDVIDYAIKVFSKAGESPAVDTVNKNAEGSKYTTPNSSYNEAVRNNSEQTGKNLWIRNSKENSNKDRVLLVQFSSNFLYGKQPFIRDKNMNYFDKLYRMVRGYNRTVDFWEIPLWIARIAGIQPNADVYVVRDINEAKKFIAEAGYKSVSFSALDVNESHILDITSSTPDQKYEIGGYTDFKNLKELDNVRLYGSMDEYISENKIKDTYAYSYRHFKGTSVIPRLKLSEGCTYKCAFCSIPKKVIPVSDRWIESQVESIKDLDAVLVYLDDKTFGQAANYNKLSEIYEKIKEYNPDFEGFIVQTTALDFANRKKFSPDYLNKSKIKYVELGVETYNDDILTKLNKRHSHKKFVDSAMQNARENDVSVIPNVIVGLSWNVGTKDDPDIRTETKETYANTLKFLNENRDIISHLNMYSLALYAGTELGDTIEARIDSDKNENIISKSWQKNKQDHTQAMDDFSDFAANQIESRAENEVKYSFEEGEETTELGFNKARMLQLLGSKMYEQPIAQVAVKELLQNSFDAVKAQSKRTGKVGKIDIEVDYDRRTIQITDNGIGMTPDIVKNSFLTVGGTNKEGLGKGESSGGFGLAKVQFLLGSSRIEVETTRDGFTTYIDITNLELMYGSFKIRKEQTDKPSGTIVKVTIPSKYKDSEGRERTIELPGDYVSEDRWKQFTILNKPLIGNVSVKFSSINWGRLDSTILPIGNSIESKIPPLFTTIQFDWGEADLYMSEEKNEYPKHEILSSGIFQFKWEFEFRDWKPIPYDIIVDVKSGVDPATEMYPFNNQREGFSSAVKQDIEQLGDYLRKYSSGEAEKEAVEKYSDLMPLVKTNVAVEMTDAARKSLHEYAMMMRSQSKEFNVKRQEAPKYIIINDTGVFAKTEGGKVEIETEKKYNPSFKAKKEIAAAAPVNTEFMNPEQPQLHNNTNIDFADMPGALEFFSDLGSVLHEWVAIVGEEFGYSYRKMRGDTVKYFSGISIDKGYGGVHIKKIINAIFVNPFYFDYDSVDEAVGGILHVFLHETTHETVGGHDANFTGELSVLYGKAYGTGIYSYFEGLLRTVFNKHFETYRELKYEFDKSSTKNISESLEKRDKSISHSRADENDVEDVQGRENAERRDIGNREGDQLGGIILDAINRGQELKSDEARLSVSPELRPVNNSLNELVKQGVYSTSQKQTIFRDVKKNLADLKAKGEPTSSDIAIAYLTELIKVRGQKQGARMEDKMFAALGKEIGTQLKELLSAKERRFITNGQFRSIINKFGKAHTPKARAKLLEYVHDTVIFGHGAKFKFVLNVAKKNMEKIKKANKGQKSKFGTARKVAERVQNIDLNELSYEELEDFTALCKKIFASTKNPNIRHLLTIDTLFGDIQKEVATQAQKITTLEDLQNYVDTITDVEIEDIGSYVTFKRMLNYARKKATEIFANLPATDENARAQEEIETIIGDIESKGKKNSGELEDALNEFRIDFANFVSAKMKNKETRDGIDLLPNKQTQLKGILLYEIPLADIQKLEINDLIALNSAVDNLRSGNMTPDMIKDLLVKLNVIHKIDTNYKTVFNNINKSSSWKDLIKRNMLTAVQNITKIYRDRSEYEQLKRLLMTKQSFRMDVLLGNFNMSKTVGRAFSEVGAAINKSNVLKQETEKKLVEAYEKFKKGKRKHKILGWQYGEDEQRYWRKFIGMFLIERRWQASDSFNERFSKENSSILNYTFIQKYNNATPQSQTDFDEDVNIYNDFFKFMQDNGATTVKDGIEIVDIQKADELLRKDTGIGALIDTIDEIVEQYKGMNEVAALFNGRSLDWKDNYIPYRSKEKGREINFDNLLAEIHLVASGAKLEAGATYEWTEKKMYLETDIFSTMNAYTEEVRRNYFVLPVVRENSMAIRQASRIIENENIDQYQKNNRIKILGDAIVETLIDRVAMYYNTGIYKNEAFALRAIEKGTKKALLAKISKTFTEYTANTLRMTASLAKIPTEAWARLKKYPDFWSDLISEHIGDSYFSRWADEVNSTVFHNTWMKYGEQAADWMITIADKSVGKPLFVQYFTEVFKENTGKMFNEDEYNSDPNYKIRYRDQIDDANTVALRRVEELFNNKNPMSQPQLVSFLGGISTGRNNEAWVRVFNYLMSFGRNESNHIVDSIRRAMKSGDPKLRMMARRDVLSVVTSNMFYGILRKISAIYEGLIVAKLFALFGLGGGGDDDEYIDKQKALLKSGKYYIHFATYKIIPDLIMGGSSNIFEYAGTLGLYTIERTKGLDENVKKRIYEIYDQRYIDRLPVYGVTDRILVQVAPSGTQPFIKDVLSFSESAIDTGGTLYTLIESIWQAHDEKLLGEKEVYDLVNLINIGTKYFGFNPVVPIIERRVNQTMFQLRKEEAKEEREKAKKGKVNAGSKTNQKTSAKPSRYQKYR